MTVILFQIALVLILMTTLAQAVFVLKVDSRDEQCIVIRSPPHQSKLYGDWESLDGLSGRPIRVEVLKDTENFEVLHKSPTGRKYGVFEVDLSPKEKVYVCVSNALVQREKDEGRDQPRRGVTRADGKARIVGLSISVEERTVNHQLRESYSGILDQARKLNREFTRLEHHQEYMRTREAKHRDVVEQTFSKLLGYVLTQCSGVIVLAVAQILYLRRYLEKKRYM